MAKNIEPEKNDKTERETRMRTAIKKAAFALMAEKGLDKVSMREIAEKVNVTKPVLYYYFKNKEDLCRSIIAEHEEAFCTLFDRAGKEALGPEDIIRRGLLFHLDFFTRDPIHSKFVLQMIAYTLNAKRLMPPKNHKNTHEKLASALQREEEKGMLPKGSAKDALALVSGLTSGMMLEAYLEQHVLKLMDKKVGSCGCHLYGKEDDAERLAKIILLGIKEYYKAAK